MGIPKCMAVAVSGLVFAGGAALAVGTAAPASAHASAAAPQQLVSDGCCGGRSHSRWHRHQRNHVHEHSRVIVLNRNHNFSHNLSRAENEQIHRQRHEMEQNPIIMRRP
ncbi:MAG: hypothetical protein JWO67_4144 [Streptosporangiaceae bacterium]|nr:hypothetical protein [Streptosporangiaceae bacterium]